MRRHPHRISFSAPRTCLQALFGFLGLGLLVLAAAASASAQSVRWDPPSGQLGFNQVSRLSLVFTDCEPELPLNLPTVEGLEIGKHPSRSTSIEMVNFSRRKVFTLIFSVRPERRTPVTIPAFEIKTDEGMMKVAAAQYTVGDNPVGNSGLSLGDVTSATLQTPRQAVWAGEVFPVTYTMTALERYLASVDSKLEWQPSPLVVNDWSKPEPVRSMVRGERGWVVTQTTLAYTKQPGIYTIPPTSLLIGLNVGTVGFGLFAQPNVEQRQLDSNPLELTVKPLPPAPPGFSGAVGTFTFTSKVVPVTAAVGEPITWTVELAGTGNWPDIPGLPEREVSNDFQVVQPKSRRTIKDGTLFEGNLSEDVVLVPTRAGTYRLPPVRFTYFDPASGTYKNITTEPVAVTVTAAPAATVPPASSGAPVQFSLAPLSPAPAAPALPAAIAPVAPENLPRDPLEGAATGVSPLTLRPLVVLCVLAALLAPLVLWLVLAALRSRVLDPQRRRREARQALATALAALRTSPQPAALQAQLRVWQTETARLWEIPHAAPGTPLVQASVTRQSSHAPTWATLWSEADRTLHGREATLPQDWVSRAEDALRAVKVPGWNPLSLFAGRNLLPFLFSLLILSAFLAPAPARANAEAYKRGDFAAAEKSWQAALKDNPADWIARHNLGLALAQQDRWAEATGHWSAAFLQNARAPVTRWDLNLGVQRSGLANPLLLELSRGEGRYKLVRAATPGEWQLLLVGAGLLLAIALAALLLQGYGRVGAWGKPTALTASLLAMLLAGTATFSLHAYGQLAHPGVVFVWKPTILRSIPTEVDTSQKTSPLSAGSIAVVEKTFLGWSKLSFAGGQAGWVRTEDVIGLYR